MGFRKLKTELRTVLEEAGFTRPTKAQSQAIGEILEGKNVLLISQTGSGKTEAAFFPILDKLIENREKRIFCLYITPLRALNRDMLNRMVYWGQKLDLDVEVRHGDTPQHTRRMQAVDPPHILITTPETLQAVLVGKRLREHLKQVEYVVVDEIHEIVSTKRGTQLACALERLKKISKFKRIGLSATVGSPEKVARFLQGSDERVDIISVKSQKDLEITVKTPITKEKDIAVSKREHVSPAFSARLRLILDYFSQDRGTLLFVNTRSTAELIASRLKKSVHHSSLSKEARIEAEKKFKNKQIRNLIATSSMELGIDVGQIDLVLQYASPRRVEVLLQRAGRSGHSMERVSEACIIANDPDDALEAAVIAKFALDGKIEPIDVCTGAYDVLAHQIVGLLMENYEMQKNDVYNILKGSFPFKDLTKEQLNETLGVLRMLRLVWGDETIRRGRKAITYYFQNMSTIPDNRQVGLVDISTRKRVASLDEEYVAELEVGELFVCKGECWRVVSKEPERILASATKSVAGAPSWRGELMPVDVLVAQEVGRIRRTKNLDLPVDHETLRLLKNDLEKNPEIDETSLTIERGDEWTVIHSCFGNKINEVIARILTSFLTLKHGTSIEVRSDQYRIMLSTTDVNTIKKILLEIDPEKVESTLRITSSQSHLFRHRFLHVARRFGVVSRNAEFSKIGLKGLVQSYEGSILFEETFQELLRDKFDIEGAKKIFKDLKNKKRKLGEVEKTSYAKRMVEGKGEVVTPGKPTAEILRALKDRLMGKRLKLTCLYCKRWGTSVMVKNGELECQNCGAKLLAVTHGEDQKLLHKRELSTKEKRTLKSMRLSADLYLSRGKDALMVMAGRGIGPKTAARILKNAKNEEELLRGVLEAEKTYARTREFWAS